MKDYIIITVDGMKIAYRKSAIIAFKDKMIFCNNAEIEVEQSFDELCKLMNNIK